MKLVMCILPLVVSVVFMSCDKDDGEVVSEQSVLSPSMLNVGNQWVYNTYQVKYDSLGTLVEKTYRSTDTFSVIGEAIVDGELYAVFDGCYTCTVPGSFSSRKDHIRIKDDKLVDTLGNARYSASFDGSVFKSDSVVGLYRVEYRARQSASSVSVPAGAFSNVIYNEGVTYVAREDNGELDRAELIDPWASIDARIGVLTTEVYYVSTSNAPIGFARELVSYSFVE